MHALLFSKGCKPRKGMVRSCANCGKEKYVQPCHLSKRNIFCNRICCGMFKTQRGITTYNCAVCDKVVTVVASQLKLRNRSTCSYRCAAVLQRKKALERREKLGYTKHQLDRLARYSPEMAKWRRAVFERDDYTCQGCGKRGCELNADHIKPFAYFEELRFELSNGRTLCVPCHNKTKKSYQEMRIEWGR